MNCSLIICTYKWPEALNLVLSSVAYQSTFPDEVIIADDGSGDVTKKLIEEYNKNISIPIIHSWQKDDGCRIPHSRNRAIAKSKYEYIIMIDGDTVLHQDFIKDHIRYAKKGVYIQGSRVLLQSEFTSRILNSNIFKRPSFLFKDSKNRLNMLRIPFFSFLLSFFKSQNINRIRGCNFSIYKEDILNVNGFNEEIPLWGREDSEFVQRLFNIGFLKQHLKFSGIQYHLYHKERKHNIINNDILEYTINNKIQWSKIGIDGYL